MSYLLNMKDDHVSFDVKEKKNQKIKIVGTFENPFFCGKDVCEILEQKDTKDVLQRIDDDYKKDLKTLSEDLKQLNISNFLGTNNLKDLSYHEGKAIYISEPGLYSLIMRSEVPFAKTFQKIIFTEILPSIRKYGSYTIVQELQEQLSAKETSEKELQKQLGKAERRAIRIAKFMKNVPVKEKKMGWIYIATTELYAQERLFKIGSTTRLSSRIGSYNTGRPQEDIYYYCWVTKCYNAKDLDYHIQKLLCDFKHKSNAELYCGIKFSDLKDIISFIVNNYDASIDYINKYISTRLRISQEEDGEDPPGEDPPCLDCKKITYYIGDHTETVNLENEDLDVIREEMSFMLNEMKQRQKTTMNRKELDERLSKITNTPKKDLLSRIKEVTGWINSKESLKSEECLYKIIY